MAKKTAPKPIDGHVPGLTQKQAWDRVNAEIRVGRMVQPAACQVCDVKEKTWGHHWRGYEYPLDVWWVCSSCNRLLTVHDGSQTLEEARAELGGGKKEERYEEYKAKQAAISRKRSAEGREIGPLRQVAEAARRESCRHSLRLFCETYHPRKFSLGWSPTHLDLIAKLEACVREGGRACVALPRGGGKTEVLLRAAEWALLYGYRRFVVVVGAEADHAKSMIEDVKRTLDGRNELVAGDWPEVCQPIAALENIAHRAAGQTLGGVSTRVRVTTGTIQFPVVPGAITAGAVIRTCGMTGAIRGKRETAADGGTLRPDLVLVDDPQTRESAKSPTQTRDRIATVKGDVLGLAGPDVELAALMACTVIYPGDLSDHFLDRDKNPQWQGTRTKMLLAWPKRMDLWDEYAELRRQSFREHGDGRLATEFYIDRQTEMDEGAEVSWPERMRPNEVSGVQCAMNHYCDDPKAFHAEYQNDPEPDAHAAGVKEFDPKAVAARTSGVPRGRVPREMTHLTAMIDCGAHLHWAAVVAWNDQGGGSVVEYFPWPRQARANFDPRDARPTLDTVFPGQVEADRMASGLATLFPEVLGREYPIDGGGAMRVEKCHVDAAWHPKVIARACRMSPFAALLMPSVGYGRTLTRSGLADWKKRPGERRGHHWIIRPSEHGGREVMVDPDVWKSIVHAALAVPATSTTALTLFGSSAAAHEMLAEHLAAESASPETSRGRKFDKWTKRPDDPPNHLLDAVVGAAVAASVVGVQFGATAVLPPAAPAKPVVMSEELARIRGGPAAIPEPPATAKGSAVAAPTGAGAPAQPNTPVQSAPRKPLRMSEELARLRGGRRR